jgi:hypothetical protein
MTQLVFSEAELFSEHDYARPNEAGGHRLHGGYDSGGGYLPPRSKGRNEASMSGPAPWKGGVAPCSPPTLRCSPAAHAQHRAAAAASA